MTQLQDWARNLFESDLNPKTIINDLRFILKTDINIPEDLVIFDEIQACPKALTSLKYFCEDMPELALSCAGSLLGLHLNESSHPVGKVDMLHLYSMTFFEFLEGIDDHYAVEFLSDLNINTTISEAIHRQLWERLKQYFITGGLPEIVSVFREHQDNLYNTAKIIRKKQSDLTDAYYADIAKHSGKVNAMHIDRTLRSVPNQLSANQDSTTSRFKFKGIIPNINRYYQLVNVIDWLEAAELIIKVPIIETVELPMSAYAKNNIFKLLMFDIEMLGTLSQISPKTLLDFEFGTYKRYFAENFVAQQFVKNNKKKLICWQDNRSEVKFLIDNDGEIVPVEVKSGSMTRAASLKKYIDKYQPKKSIILSGNNLYVNPNQKIFHIPLYLAEKAVELVSE